MEEKANYVMHVCRICILEAGRVNKINVHVWQLDSSSLPQGTGGTTGIIRRPSTFVATLSKADLPGPGCI